MPVLVAPSILSADFANLAADLKKAEDGKADWIHVDVMDGHFVPNITIGIPVVKSLRKNTRLPLDVHLMITEPDRYLTEFAEAGADHLIVHAEACTHLQRTLAHVRGLGKLAGVALNPHTDESVLRYVLADLDLVLVMTVNPGFGGQKFISEVVPKITALRRMLDEAGNQAAHISVDGGIDHETARIVTAAGANVVVAGKSVYGSGDVAKAIKALHDAGQTKIGAA
jgi:ribulose-phosphate 3-epimerase